MVNIFGDTSHERYNKQTRVNSIESQPKKIVVVVVIIVFVVVHVVVVVIAVVDPRNLPLKFGQNQVSNSWDNVVVVVIVVVDVVVIVVLVFIHDVAVDPRNLKGV